MFTERYRKMGAKIAYYRKLGNYTQEQFAEKIGISASYLSRIERGKYSNGVSMNVLLIIAKGLEVDICKLLEE